MGVVRRARQRFGLTEEREERAVAGRPEWFGEHDLYPEVRPMPASSRSGIGVSTAQGGARTEDPQGMTAVGGYDAFPGRPSSVHGRQVTETRWSC
ncbi:hypothetical protein GCM10010415_50830 [Streptomyces atrovirens]